MTLKSLVPNLVLSAIALLLAPGALPPATAAAAGEAAAASPALQRVRGADPVLGDGVPNDTCAGAIVVPSCGNPAPTSQRTAWPILMTPVNIASATTDGDPAPPCKTNKRTGGVWYVFSPHVTGKFRFSTCQIDAPGTTASETIVAIYGPKTSCTDSPQKLNNVACGGTDSQCTGSEGQSAVSAKLTAFKNYYIVVYGNEDSTPGSVQLSIDLVQEGDLADGNFEQGVLGLSWYPDGDTTLMATEPPPPCFGSESPDWGCYMACFSTKTFFGGEATNLLRSDLTSQPVLFSTAPDQIKVSFSVDFQTEEPLDTLGSNDAFQASLVTTAGTIPILQIDTFGRTIPTSNLKVSGFEGFFPSPEGCTLVNGRDTRLLTVSWTKSVNTNANNRIGRGPVYLVFTIVGQGNTGRTSIACVDNVQVTGTTN